MVAGAPTYSIPTISDLSLNISIIQLPPQTYSSGQWLSYADAMQASIPIKQHSPQWRSKHLHVAQDAAAGQLQYTALYPLYRSGMRRGTATWLTEGTSSSVLPAELAAYVSSQLQLACTTQVGG